MRASFRRFSLQALGGCRYPKSCYLVMLAIWGNSSAILFLNFLSSTNLILSTLCAVAPLFFLTCFYYFFPFPLKQGPRSPECPTMLSNSFQPRTFTNHQLLLSFLQEFHRHFAAQPRDWLLLRKRVQQLPTRPIPSSTMRTCCLPLAP